MSLPLRPRSATLAAILFLAGCALCPLLPADTVILTDGSELEGKILEETDAYVKIEIQVSKSIKDTKIIPRADIRQLTKESPESELYAEMQAVLPTRDRMNVTDYDELLTLYPRRFASEYPSSPLLPKVREFEKKLDDEKERVASGSVKLEGKWISPKEIAADPYNHEAKILAADMKALAAEGNLTGALQKFDLLEAGYPYATATSAAYEPALKALDAYDAGIKRSLRENPIKLAERQKQLASFDPQGRQAAEDAFAGQVQAFETEWESARAAKMKWLPISIWDKKSLAEAAKAIASEKTRLGNIDAAARGQAATVLAVFFIALADGKFEAAELQLQKAAEAGVDAKSITAFRARVSAAKTAAEAAAAAAPAPTDDTPPSETTPPEPEIPSDPAPAEEEPEPAPAPVKEAEPEPAPAPAAESKKPAKPGPAKTGTTPPVKKGTSRDFSGLLDPEDVEGEEKAEAPPAISFRTILFILIGVMIVATVLAKVFSKPPPEDFEEAVPEDGDEGDETRR